MIEQIKPLRGQYRDILLDSRGVTVFDSGWKCNRIVDSCRVLLAAFMRFGGGSESPAGIRNLRVGSGDPAWDTSGPTTPSAGETSLVTGFSEPVTNLAFSFIDPISDVESPFPTNRLQIAVTLPPGYPTPPSGTTTYPLREFGLFAILGGTDTMINCVRHPVIHKDLSSTLLRTIQLIF
jgi:hypothetical protein